MFIILASEKDPRGWKETSWRSKGDQKWWWKFEEKEKQKDLEKNKDDDEDLKRMK